MEILGIGAPELIFIILIAIIVLGPKDMQKAGKTVGRWLNQLVNSDGWKALQQTSREIRKLPTQLMKEANLDLQETEQALRKGLDIRPNRSVASSTSTASSTGREELDPPLNASSSLTLSAEVENTILPPAAKPIAPAAVPGGESSAEDGSVSTNTEQND